MVAQTSQLRREPGTYGGASRLGSSLYPMGLMYIGVVGIMHRFLLQRILQSIGIVLVVSLIVFCFVHASGDPAALLVPEQATPAEAAHYRQALGLDRPLYQQYFQFMSQFWFSDTITSFRFRQPLLPLVMRHLWITLILAGLTMVVSSVLAVPLGILAAIRRGSGVDVGIRVIAVLGQAMPSFWVAMLLMLILAVHLRLFPVSGLGVKHIVLPTITLAFFQMALLLRLVRSEMLEVMSQDYIRTAKFPPRDCAPGSSFHRRPGTPPFHRACPEPAGHRP